jgi:branched-chain amino acid transport system substrate-binding protein
VVVGRYISNVLEAETIAVLHDNTSYGEGLASTVRDTFEELGGEVVTFEAIDPEEQDYRATLTAIAESEPDVVYFGGYTNQAALLVQQMQEVGLEDAVFFSDNGVYNQDFIDLSGDAGEGSFVSFGEQVGNEEANEEFDAAYEEAFGVAPDELGPFHAQAYDAANVILNALVEVAETDDAGNLVIDREALLEAIRTTADFEGLSGVITCDETGDCGSARIGILTLEDGEWVSVEVPEELQVSSDDMMEE